MTKKNNNYDFDLITSSEELNVNKQRELVKKNIIKKRRQLRKWVKDMLFVLSIVVLILTFIGINGYFENEIEKHIEKVSIDCAIERYGIKAKYSKEGDKFYVCNR